MCPEHILYLHFTFMIFWEEDYTGFLTIGTYFLGGKTLFPNIDRTEHRTGNAWVRLEFLFPHSGNEQHHHWQTFQSSEQHIQRQDTFREVREE